MTKFRASFTVLNLWESGRQDDAIKLYFKLPSYVSPQMEDGKKYHQAWAEYIDANKCLPEELCKKDDGTIVPHIFKDPKTEIKLVTQIFDWLEVVCVIDCLDGSDLYEWKTGIAESNSYASSHQAGVYAAVANINKFPVKRIWIKHYNQYTRKSDTSIFWASKQMMQDSLDWVETQASDMHSFLLEEKLYEKLGKRASEDLDYDF